MAIYLDIIKSDETEETVNYVFCDLYGNSGELSMDKRTGSVEEISCFPNDAKKKKMLMAAHKIRKHLETGEFPEKMTWAS